MLVFESNSYYYEERLIVNFDDYAVIFALTSFINFPKFWMFFILFQVKENWVALFAYLAYLWKSNKNKWVNIKQISEQIAVID